MDPRARDLVLEGWDHLKLQRPLAAWASWQRALRVDPDDLAAQKALDRLAAASELPASARAVYRFATPTDEARRSRWDARLRRHEGALEDLGMAEEVFAGLAADDPDDPDAWQNRALCLSWLGRNPEAIMALGTLASLLAEPDPDRAAGACTLAEVLRLGAGAEGLADDLSYARTVDGFDASWLGALPNLRPVDVPAVPGAALARDVQVFEWLDREVTGSSGVGRCLASVIVRPSSARFSSPDPTGLAALDDLAHIPVAFADALANARKEAFPLPLAWADAALGTFRYPAGFDPEARRDLARSAVEHYYEHTWPHLPRHGLDGLSPLETSRVARNGDRLATARLSGLVRFREQLGARPTHAEIYQGYPFDRLRRRLGLPATDPELPGFDPLDVSCMSETELGLLDPATLSGDALADGFTSASGLRADPLTARFAAELIRRRPPELARLSLLDVASPLVREALAAGPPGAALDWLDQARNLATNDERHGLTVWSAEVLALAGDPDASVQTYQSILADCDVRQTIAAASFLLDNGYPGRARLLLNDAQARATDAGVQAVLGEAAKLLERADD